MKHIKALLIKFAASLALLYVILGLMYEMTFGEVFILSAVLGIAAYLIGDMFILPRTNNAIATIADFGLALMIIYLFADGMTVADNAFTASLFAALGVGLFELFFHRYLANQVLPDHEDKDNRERTADLQFQTEIADEMYEYSEKDKDEK
ncbi:YndM family protein [Oceanobacillus halotolerans]|uniref:YndM family protein n=1 Tax=Oceanobacillus halotolerans TaxID=2663380 RepID=UPI0013DAF6DD|nr:YndM family protein [Oceanobacillus halotolerans]